MVMVPRLGERGFFVVIGRIDVGGLGLGLLLASRLNDGLAVELWRGAWAYADVAATVLALHAVPGSGCVYSRKKDCISLRRLNSTFQKGFTVKNDKKMSQNNELVIEL